MVQALKGREDGHDHGNETPGPADRNIDGVGHRAKELQWDEELADEFEPTRAKQGGR